MDDDDQDERTEEQPSNFLVLASQTETQYSEWDQQHLLQSLPALRSQSGSKDDGKQKVVGNPFQTKSDDERQNVPASLLVADTGSDVSRHEETDVPDRIEDSFSEEESDTAANVTVVKKSSSSNNNNEDQCYSPVYKSQEENLPTGKQKYGTRDLRNVRNLFPSTLSQGDVVHGQENEDDHIVATPSEHIGSLRLSGEPIRVPETVEESLEVLAPSPGAYGDVPVIIPSSPTASCGDAETSGFNPDADRTLEDEDVLRGRRRRDRRERLPPASPRRDAPASPRRDEPITIEDTAPEGDEEVMLDPNVRTLACEQSQGESLHLMYSATEAGTSRSSSEEKKNDHKDDNIDEEENDKDSVENSQDLALHLSQSQGEAIVGAGRSAKSKSLSQPAAASQSKSSSSSTGSGRFHLSVPKDGSLIHPVVTSSNTKGDQKAGNQCDHLPSMPTAPSLSISRIDSQSQSASDTTFRIEKPDLHMTEEGEEGGSEMNVFQKTRIGRKKPVHKQLNQSDESSEDVFNIEKTRSKTSSREREQAASQDRSGSTLTQDGRRTSQRKGGNVDQDAETQEDNNLEVPPELELPSQESRGQSLPEKNLPTWPDKAAEAAHPFDESTETYEVPKSTDIEIVEDSRKKDPHPITISSTSLADDSKSQSLRTRIEEEGMDVDPAVEEEKGEDMDPRVEEEEGEDMDPRVEEEEEDIDPRVEEEEGKDMDPRTEEEASATEPRSSHVTRSITDPMPSTSKLVPSQEGESRPGPRRKTKVSTASKTSAKTRALAASKGVRSVPGVESPSTSIKTRGRQTSLAKDSGIGEQLDVTSDVSPKRVQKSASTERQASDPYVFHGTQSQQAEPGAVMDALPTTPLSSRKKQKGLVKRVISRQDANTSSSSDMKAPVARPRPKKLRFTKVQKKVPQRPSTIAESSTAGNNAENVLKKQATVVIDPGFDADISRSTSSQNTAQRHVVFQDTAERTSLPSGGESGKLSDSQASDQLSEIVSVTIVEKVVKIKTTVRKVINKDGKIIEHHKQEECGEPSLTTVFFSEKTKELPLVSPSRTGSSLTPGDLADISSGFSRSNSTNSTKSSLEKVSSIDLISPSVHRQDESFTALLTCSSTHLPLAQGITTSVLSPQVSVHENRPSLSGHRTSDVHIDTHVNTPDASVIEKADSHLGAVVSSSDGHRVSDSLFTSPEAKKDKGASSEDNVIGKQASPALKKRAADSSQDSSSDIPSAQRPRIAESGGFSVHGPSYSPRAGFSNPRLDAPLNILVTSDSDIPPSQNRSNILTGRSKVTMVTEKSSSDHISPEIPLQTTSNTSETDIQCHVVHASTPEIGSIVMAKWKDGFFYPGKIMKLDQNGRFYIRFDDGDQMYVKGQNILLVQHIPIGQSVMVMSQDGYFDCGMVVGYEEKKGKLLYKVSKDEGDTQRFTHSQIILSEDQASCLMSDEDMRVPAAITAGLTSTKIGDVSLDNLVVGERRSRLRTEEDRPDKKKENEESPKKSNTGSRSVRKGRSAKSDHKDIEKEAKETKESSSRGKKRKQPEGPMATSTPTPKSKRPAQSTVSVTPSTSGMGGAVDSPSTSRRQTRRTRVGLFDKEPTVQERPLPRQQLFSGMVFLLTHVEKSQEQKLQEKKLLQDSSLETSTEESGVEDEPSVPFDKESLRANIQAQGGVVLEQFDQSQIDRAKRAFLVSSTFQRTVKYFECLAAGIPCVSHQWIIHSCSQNKLLDHKAYILPAGISLERRKLMEWNPCGSCLSGMIVMVVSTNIKFQDAWRSILTISRCQLVNRLPIRNKSEDQVDFIVSDVNCPSSILHQAKRTNVPVVSTEWVIQCLINGHMVGFDAHPQYKQDFQEK